MKIRRRTTQPARIEMLPLIDIVFLLLVFFIYAMLSMAVHRGLQLDLPEASQAKISSENTLKLFIRINPSSGLDIFSNKQQVTPAELEQRLRARMQNGPEPLPVQVFAEEKINYQQLYQVLDVLNRSGCRDISLQASSE